MLETNGIHKIAVLRANAIGDFIFALPALDALRRAYPDAEITLLGRPWHCSFISSRPSPVDRVVAVPASRGVNDEDFRAAGEDPAELDAFFAAMRRERFDLAIQIHGGGRFSNPFIKRLGARLTIGLKSPDAAALDRWVPYVYLQPETLRYLEVMSLIGVPPLSFTARLTPTAADLAESYALIPEDHESYVLLNPNAGDPLRRWPLPRFAALGRKLGERGVKLLIAGARADAGRCAELARLCGTQAADVSGKLSLSGLVGLMRRCALVISNDSGPLHLAIALGVPTVGIYWYPNLLNATPGTRTLHRPVVSWLAQCPHCGTPLIRMRCSHLSSLVADIGDEEVLCEAQELLALRPAALTREAPPPWHPAAG